jgi:transcription initiation factor TFIIH subunit 4
MSAATPPPPVVTTSSTLLSCSTLISYLKTLDAETLSELYDHPATCLAVFRELPALAKQFVMRLFYVEQPVPKAVVLSWVNKASHGGHDKSGESTSALSDLGLWQETSMPGGLPAWILDKTFRSNLKIVLIGG